MQSGDRLYTTFLDDGKAFSQNIHHLLLKLSSRPNSVEFLRQLLRNAHSLKSEAAYIGIDEVTSIAHQMETTINLALTGKELLSSRKVDDLIFSNDRIGEILDFLLSGGDSKETISVEGTKDSETSPAHALSDGGLLSGLKERDGTSIPSIVGTALPDFSPFETNLLKEARRRGEGLYRLFLNISRDAAMPFAKAYLLLSNLEQVSNVIRTIPLFRPDQDISANGDDFRSLTIFLTSKGAVKQLYQAVHIDQVDSISLTPVSYAAVLESEGEEDEGVHGDVSATIRVEPRLLNLLAGYIDELKLSLHQLERRIDRRKEEPEAVASNLAELGNLIEGLESVGKTLSKVRLSELFAGYPGYVAEMAQRLGKKVRLVLSGGELDVDRRIAELLGETILHLLRNGVDHGIEFPGERLKAGKDEEGTIRLDVHRGAGGLSLSVSDDGRGIDKEKLSARLGEDLTLEGDAEGTDGGRANKLAALLARPGITTKDEATDLSGRGFGLDIVYRKIGRIEGAYLEAESEDGKGTRFTITIPGGASFITLKMVRCEQLVLAVPERSILSVEEASDGTFGGDAEGRLEWNGIPVFSPDGRLFRTDRLPPQELVLIMQHLDRKGAFLVDELLFTREVPEEQFTLFVEESPFLYRSSIGGRKSGFLYLSPSVVAIN
ncbi:chemotaxis protein CheA [Sediminispirochaeta smaragdinae]|uniref:Chemotaxis protein CheA n=1 Tax=Sediminispirochaeta smaragdinae (strain DSM 11293 / JCM 15392 / SEBR 4228) TaxID=573413 RepID=E1R5V4_SEDSS|nr:ATP-binding protein [Sediminispirochaeta smaragdinae]ADK80719.1 CheA signal transduction histidine kinase [Sediminispirochaeta smaragdinae DSM 11293]